MIEAILVLLSFGAILFMTVIGAVVFFHFRKFGLPEDPVPKRILNVFEIGSLFIILFNIVLLALNILKK